MFSTPGLNPSIYSTSLYICHSIKYLIYLGYDFLDRSNLSNDDYIGFISFKCLIVTLLGLAITLTGCSSNEKDTHQKIRPVKTIRITNSQTDSLRFAGQIQSHNETSLSFQVGGKVTARYVDVGAHVRKGQPLAELDPKDYQLSQESLKAQLNAVRVDLTFLKDDIARYRDLFEQKLISQPKMDKHLAIYNRTKEQLAALQAQLAQAQNQLAYTKLASDRAGIVTGIFFESGQVVASGQTLIKIANDNDKEVLIHIPENLIGQFHLNQEALITLWSEQPAKEYPGQIREIAGAADPQSRTFDIKVKFAQNTDKIKLGMTAQVQFQMKPAHHPLIPLSAVFTRHDSPEQTRVWQVNEIDLTVHSIPVQLGEIVANEFAVVRGLPGNALVVTAGVHRLTEGEKISILN